MRPLALLLLALLLPAMPAAAQPMKILTAGAMKTVVTSLVPGFQSRTGVEVQVLTDTAGALVRRIQAGEAFDIVVLTSGGLDTLAAAGKLDVASVKPVGRVGIGVAVKKGAPLPPLATADDFRQAMLGARKVAVIDPAAGGSSGIYLQGLFQRLGIAEPMQAKAVLVPGGLTAERVVRGEAELALQQASELLAVDGVVLAGMLPAAIQNYTTYGVAIAAGTRLSDAAEVFVGALGRDTASQVMRMMAIEPVKAP